MIQALWSAASGLQAQQLKVDTISNNLANVNTTGFKSSRVVFQDLLYQNLPAGRGAATLDAAAGAGGAAGAGAGGTTTPPTLIQIGTGTAPGAVVRDFGQGALEPTERPFDLALDGPGFFRVKMVDGTIAFTRDGNFNLDINRQLVDANGNVLLGNGSTQVTLPQDFVQVRIDRQGNVTALLANGTEQSAGTIQVALFDNPAGLESIGGNLYRETASSGAARLGQPLAGGAGGIAQGFLEGSNVQVVSEMVNLIVAQRAYELNSKAVQSADEMLGIANNLRR